MPTYLSARWRINRRAEVTQSDEEDRKYLAKLREELDASVGVVRFTLW